MCNSLPILCEKSVQNLIIALGKNGSVVAGLDKSIPQPVNAEGCRSDSGGRFFCRSISYGAFRRYSSDASSCLCLPHGVNNGVTYGGMSSLPTIEEVQTLRRKRGYNGFDTAILDTLK